MNDFQLEYILDNHGWATVTLSYGPNQFSSSVSYLHDSLSDLVTMALGLKSGSDNASTLFMGEPGELQFMVQVDRDTANCEGRWFKDWASWGIVSEDAYELVVSGSCDLENLITQIYELLKKIHDEIGPEKYLERWVEHPFPIEKYQSLSKLMSAS